MTSQLHHRSLNLWAQPPPEPRTRASNNPTLLFSWWATCFSAAIIITRLCGRKIRSNVLFREDWIMMLALVPLFARMAFVHVVLLHGTNNVQTAGLTELQIEHRELGSRMVLAARIFYAMFIWISKLTVSEFLKRITIRIWRRSYELTLQGIRIFLFVTFAAVVVSTLAGCQPFDHYWQVIPDPGPQCRFGFSNLITMGTCDIVTDVLLVAFPIPIVLRSGQSWKRKFQLASLFSLSIVMIGITASRVPEVIKHRGQQQYRTVWASCEILASAAVSNAVILGSFLRDKGTKKNKYRTHSMADSIERASVRRVMSNPRHANTSDEDLFRFLGMRVPEHLREKTEFTPRPAQAMPPAPRHHHPRHHHHQPSLHKAHRGREDASSSSSDSLRKPGHVINHDPDEILPNPKRNVSFLDVGGLLEANSTAAPLPPPRSPLRQSHSRSPSPSQRSHSTTVVSHNGTIAQDFAPATPSQSRRGSRALVLSDVGDLLAKTPSHSSSGFERYIGRRQSDSQVNPPSRHFRVPPTGVLGPMLERHETQQSLKDVGGLLGGASEVAPPPPRSAGSRLETIRSAVGSRTELQDLGGLLAEDEREEDASAVGLKRAQERRAGHAGAGAEARGGKGWEGAPDVHDPGGLLR